MVSPNEHRQDVFSNSQLVETIVVREDPPGTFTFIRMNAAGTPVEQRAATLEEVEGLTRVRAAAARTTIERAVRDIDSAAITSIPAARDAIITLRDLLMLTSRTDDD